MAPVYSKHLWAALAVICVAEKNRKKRKWSRRWLLERQRNSHVTLLRELSQEESNFDFINYLRMDQQTFHELLNLVSPVIHRQDTNMRNAISAEERLTATLRFLATGRSYTDLQYSTRISRAALSELIPETCKAIYNVLKAEYLKVKTIYYFNARRIKRERGGGNRLLIFFYCTMFKLKCIVPIFV